MYSKKAIALFVHKKRKKIFFFYREKKISRSSALKVLDHAMIGPEGADNCHKFVDILGLRTIFPLFMKSPRKIKKVGTTEKEHEGRVPLVATRLLGTGVPPLPKLLTLGALEDDFQESNSQAQLVRNPRFPDIVACGFYIPPRALIDGAGYK